MSRSHTDTAPATAEAATPAHGPMTHFRWAIVVMLFLATTINYIHRSSISFLKPVLDVELGWSQQDFGNLIMITALAYAVGYAMAGRLLDWIGVRLGYTLSMACWSVAATAQAFLTALTPFAIARGALGFTQGGNFPSAIKAVTEYFPRRERAFAIGLFNTGSGVGAIICPLLVAWLAKHYGWRETFLITGSLGFVWVVLWLLLYRPPDRHPRVSPAELALIRSDGAQPAVARISWLSLLGHRQTWAFIVGMAMSAPVWWFYVNWMPDFLNRQHGIKLGAAAPPLMTIFMVSNLGSITGGWLSMRLLKRGWSINASRKTAMLAFAMCAVPVWLTPLVDNVWVAVALVSLAAAAHCGFVANLFALVSDTVPFKAVSSVIGIGGMAAALAGAFAAKMIGMVLDKTGDNYMIPFAVASFAYLVALLTMHLLLPRWQSMKMPPA